MPVLSLLAQSLYNPPLNGKLGNSTTLNSRAALSLMLRNLINVAFGFAGVYFFIMLLRGGYEYINAGGDKEAVQKAQKRLTNAFIGIIIVFSAFAFLYVVEVLFGVDIRKFNIPAP